jgi:hypothetical protein
VQDHAFSPLTFHDANGRNPLRTDWCSHRSGEQVCGELAAAHPATPGETSTVGPGTEALRAAWLIKGWAQVFAVELLRSPAVSCSPADRHDVNLLAERLATAAYGVLMGRPHPLAGLLDQIDERRLAQQPDGAGSWQPSPAVSAYLRAADEQRPEGTRG